jgi:hypothetical protein
MSKKQLFTEEERKILEALDDEYEAKFQKIKSEVSVMFDVNQNELSDEVVKQVSKMHYYSSILSEERQTLYKIKRKAEEVHGEVYDKYRYEDTKRTKSEIDEWINRDVDWQYISTKYENQKIIVEYYARVVDNIRDKGFMIKNLIELKKIDLGMRV